MSAFATAAAACHAIRKRDLACKFPGDCETLEGDHCERCHGKRARDRELVRRVIEHAKSTPIDALGGTE